MKKLTLFFIVWFITSGTLLAQHSDRKWAVLFGPGIDYNLETEDAGFLANLGFSRYLSPTFDLMLDTRVSFTDPGVDVVNPLLNLRLKLFKERNKVQPYLFGGAGYMWDNDDEGINFDGGAGVKIPLSPKTALFVAGSYVAGIEGTRNYNGVKKKVTDNHVMLTGVLEFDIGKGNDTDGDGVTDRKDECPNTPAVVIVDEKGCPVDRDRDGVPDYKDDCPDIAGSIALNGCPDKDGDGIADKNDRCPDVPGLMKLNGCPDSDGDGVKDSEDQCPKTPKGYVVDANGCALDTDGDGVVDSEDKCPQEAGLISNNGCPAKWETLVIAPVYFDFDKAVIKQKYISELNKLADQLDKSKEYEVVVGGHTCNIGTETYNMKLSEKRAQAVVKHLMMRGINNTFVGANSYGESKPAVKNDTKSHRKLNRRVEFEVVKVKK